MEIALEEWMRSYLELAEHAMLLFAFHTGTGAPEGRPSKTCPASPIPSFSPCTFCTQHGTYAPSGSVSTHICRNISSGQAVIVLPPFLPPSSPPFLPFAAEGTTGSPLVPWVQAVMLTGANAFLAYEEFRGLIRHLEPRREEREVAIPSLCLLLLSFSPSLPPRIILFYVSLPLVGDARRAALPPPSFSVSFSDRFGSGA